MLAQRPSAFIPGRKDHLAHEASTIPDVVVLVVLSQVKHVLTQEFGLLGVGQTQLGGEIQDLELNNVFL